jgi:hypothetical protein
MIQADGADFGGCLADGTQTEHRARKEHGERPDNGRQQMLHA